MFTQEVADSVLSLLAEGKSLRKSAKEAGTSEGTVYRWLDVNPQFAEEYARVRACAYRMLADEIIEISDEADVEAKYEGDDVRLDLSATAVARNRLRVDSRKWMLSKMLPKVYGDKLELGGGLELNQKIERITRRLVDSKADSGIGPRDASGI